jgi:hypothetical protein
MGTDKTDALKPKSFLSVLVVKSVVKILQKPQIIRDRNNQ